MATPFKLRNGMLLLSTEAPGGIYNSTQLKKIAQLCDGDAALVKATEDQRLALFVPPAKLKTVTAELAAVGIGVRNYQDGLHQPVSCLGELCSEHLQDAQGAAMDMSQELAKVMVDAPLRLGINGCSRCCVPTHTLDVSVIGDTNGYRINLGGKNSQIPEMATFMAEGVPAAKLPKLIAKVVKIYKDLAQKDESLQEVMERAGSSKFIEALAPYSQDAHQDDGMPGIDPMDMGGGDALQGDVPIDGDGGMEELGDEITTDDTDLDLSAPAEIEDSLAAAPDDMGAVDDLGSMEGDPLTEDALSGDALENDALAADAELSLDIGDEGDGESELSLEDEMQSTAGDDDEIKLDAGGEDLLRDEMMELGFDEPVKPAPAPKAAAHAPAPVRVAAPADGEDERDLESASEVSDDEADAFEEKLNASIAEEEGVPDVEDENENDRLAALELVESEEGMDDGASSAPAAADFDDLEIDKEEIAFETEELGDGDLELAPAAALKLSSYAAQAVVDAHAGDELALDDGDLEGVALDDAPMVVDEFETEELTMEDMTPVTPVASIAPRSQPAASTARGVPKKSLEFSGIDMVDGKLAVTFANGAQMVLDPSNWPNGVRRDLNMFGKRITVMPDASGITIEVDGVGFTLPRNAA